jgi:hypothetical protein
MQGAFSAAMQQLSYIVGMRCEARASVSFVPIPFASHRGGKKLKNKSWELQWAQMPQRLLSATKWIGRAKAKCPRKDTEPFTTEGKVA